MDYRICVADGCTGQVPLLNEAGRSSRARYCTPGYSPSYRADKRRRKEAGLRSSRDVQHGLDDVAYRALMAQGKCDACGTTDPGHKNGWAIDHDHVCCPGKFGCPECIRGLLCQGCNMALGFVKDDANRLLDLYAYLYRDQGMPVPKFQEALNGA